MIRVKFLADYSAGQVASEADKITKKLQATGGKLISIQFHHASAGEHRYSIGLCYDDGMELDATSEDGKGK